MPKKRISRKVTVRQASPEELEALKADGPRGYRPPWVYAVDTKRRRKHLGTTKPPP